jgi:hypothetical protein
MNTVLTRPEIHRKATQLLLEQLGIDGYVEYMRDLGLSHGDFTRERHEIAQPTIEEIALSLNIAQGDTKK